MSDVYFILKCRKCNWWRRSTGLSADLQDLAEVKGCVSCGGRKFKCPKCGTHIKLMRVRNASNKKEGS